MQDSGETCVNLHEPYRCRNIRSFGAIGDDVVIRIVGAKCDQNIVIMLTVLPMLAFEWHDNTTGYDNPLGWMARVGGPASLSLEYVGPSRRLLLMADLTLQ